MSRTRGAACRIAHSFLAFLPLRLVALTPGWLHMQAELLLLLQEQTCMWFVVPYPLHTVRAWTARGNITALAHVPALYPLHSAPQHAARLLHTHVPLNGRRGLVTIRPPDSSLSP